MAKSSLDVYELADGLGAVHARSVAHAFPRHAHESYLLGLVLSGRRTIRVEQRELLLKPGGLFQLNPGQSHDCREEGDYFVIYCRPEPMRERLAEIRGREIALPYFTPLAFRDDALAAELRLLLTRLAGAAGPRRRRVQLNQIFRRWAAYGDEAELVSGRDGEHLPRAVEYMRQAFGERLSLADIAAQAYLSPCHFQRSFVRRYGLSPLEYLAKVRVNHASRLLAEGQAAAGAALDSGFCDQSHFSRVFGKLMGTTPSNYRRRRLSDASDGRD